MVSSVISLRIVYISLLLAILKEIHSSLGERLPYCACICLQRHRFRLKNVDIWTFHSEIFGGPLFFGHAGYIRRKLYLIIVLQTCLLLLSKKLKRLLNLPLECMKKVSSSPFSEIQKICN
ncbi:hypothetical protein KP509_24G024600 [Ceratopteris richardii]|uniref:Secreted protein n=1 Tax=Ceratopteris richardii TaxID=49495 RepID=A0A8T2RTY6_CERRI|nr:hypothetical protein KP509_24G024600 [Ceratopteris richardii]